MALNAYLQLKGQRQGLIKGSVTQKGKEGKIMVIAASHELSLPWDISPGAAVNREIKIPHQPFMITKELDQSSPLLYLAMVKNETLTEFELQFFAPEASRTGTGLEKQVYTVKLSDARICSIKFNMLNNKNPDLVRYAEYEEVYFTYSKIEWIWNSGGITASDIWGKVGKV